MKTSKKNIHFTPNISLYTGHRHFQVLQIVKVCFFKNSHYAYILPYIHKTVETLGNEKEQ